MKNAIVKLGFCLLLFCVAHAAYATPPTVTVTRVTSNPTKLTSGIQFTVTFSASVGGFTNTDVVLTNDVGTPTSGATTISVTPAGPAAVYTVTVDNVTAGTFSVSIPAAAATETAVPNDPSVASAGGTPQIVVDTVGPIATITDPGPDPTTGGTSITFNVSFNEAIDPATFTSSSVAFTGSGGGVIGSLSVSAITELAPLDHTKYEIVVAVNSATATGNLHVLVTLPGTVKDPAGNSNTSVLTDNDVIYAGVLPTLAAPTATPTDVNFTVFGEVLTSGGRSVTDRGTVWSLTSPVGLSDHSANTGTGTGTFNQVRATSVTSHTKYYYATWATNAVGTALGPQSFVWTLDDAPAASGNMTSATATSGSQIDLVFPAFGSGADGLVVIRKNGGTGYTSSDLLQGKAPNQQPGYVMVISSSSATTFSDTGLSGGQQYTYSVIPYTVFSTQDSTTNYKTTFNTKTATTITALSRIIQNTSAANTLDYASKQSMTIDAASKGLSLADVKLVDGNSPADDPDTNDTNLKTLTIHVDNFAFVGHVAILKGSTIVSEGTLDVAGNITFNIATGVLQATDNDDNGQQFNIIANFAAVVDDGAVIKVTITGATVYAGSSGLVDAAAGGYSTGATRNAIAVVATKFVFSGVTNPVNPGLPWGFTATLKDDLDNIDTNIGGNLTISEASLTGTLMNPITLGVASFSGLTFADAGSKSVILDASNWGGSNNGTLVINCESLGVAIHGPVNQEFCLNNSDTTKATFTTLKPIGIVESDKGDFGAGNGQTFSLQLPPGFIFYTKTTGTYKNIPVFTKQGNEVSNITFVSYPANNVVRFKYDVSGTTNTTLDTIGIKGLLVKYAGTDTVWGANIIRVGGTASQDGNADTDGKSLGTLRAVGGSTGVTFENVPGPGYTASQTAFDKNVAWGPVTLLARNSSDNSIISGSNAVFSGDGVVYDGTNYKFYPDNLVSGSHNIMFTYTDVGTQHCISTAVKTYVLFESLISSLNSAYCYRDPVDPIGGPTSSYATSAALAGTCLVTIFPTVTYQNAYLPSYVYEYLEIDSVSQASSYQPFPSLSQFNPKSPQWAYEVRNNHQVQIHAYYPLNPACILWFGASTYDLGTSIVKVWPTPTMNVFPKFPDGACGTDGVTTLSADQYDATNGYDEFWSSKENNHNIAKGAITGSRATVFTFDPKLTNNAAADDRVQINYRHKDIHGCFNTDSAVVVNVWKKPAKMSPTQLKVNGVALTSNTYAYCYKDATASFTITKNPLIAYTWGSKRNPQDGNVFPMDVNDFSSVTGGLANIGATANYTVQQITHRTYTTRFNFFTFQFDTLVNYAGCKSDTINLKAFIRQPTIASVKPSTTICTGNQVALKDPALVGASISSPVAGANGYWKTSSTGAARGVFKDASGNVDSTFLGAAKYYPSTQEYSGKSFVLTLTTFPPVGPLEPCLSTSADITVFINPGLNIDFPVPSPRQCSADALAVQASLLNNVFNVGATWTTNGDGTIDVARALPVVYRPSQTEKDQGKTVRFILTTDDPDDVAGPCLAVKDTIFLVIDQRPQIALPANFSICSDTLQLKTVPLQATLPAGKSSAVTFRWHNLTSASTGVIQDSTAITTIYKPVTDTTSSNVENPGVVRQQFNKTLTFNVTAYAPIGNVCPAETPVVPLTVIINGTPRRPKVDNPDIKYCVNDVISNLKTSVPGPTWYKANSSNLPVFHSAQAEVSSDVLNTFEQQKVQFWLTQKFDGCESYYTPFTITVNSNPVAGFKFKNQCFGDIMQFSDSSSLPDPFSTGRTIATYEWLFDDGIQTIPGAPTDDVVAKNTTGKFNGPNHKYDDIRKYNVRVNEVSSDGCKSTFTKLNIEVGPVPVAGFTTKLVCDQDNTAFTSSTGLPTGTKTFYKWDFDDVAAVDTARNPMHRFTGVGTYDVTMIARTKLNCADTITQAVSIFPFIKAAQFPYAQNFESANHGWVAEGFVSNGTTTTTKTSWTRLTSAGSIASDPAPAAGSTFWATHTSAGNDNSGNPLYYYDNERSILYGPCADISTLARPVVALDYFTDTEAKSDGAYLEYKDETTNVDTVWVRLGDSNSGLDWYNDSSIGGLSQFNNVGQTLGQYGWDGTSTAWQTGRYNLDAIAKKKRVRFRIVFGSNTSPVNTDTYDGFALDLFKLESRNRLVLVENFTAASTVNTNVAANRDAFKTFPSVGASSEVVKIEYHVGIPANAGDTEDPIYTQNPMDPNARASFYGLSAVPRGYIDGYSDFTHNGFFTVADGWAAKEYSTESLRTSPVKVTFTGNTITNGVMNIKGEVVPTDFVLPANTYSLYIAVVEQVVDKDAFVLRKMLPSAAGIKIPLTAVNSSFEFDVSWQIDKSYLWAGSTTPQLVAVAFVQADIITPNSTGSPRRQVLQAAYSNAPTVTFTTGLEIPAIEQIVVYPNPADRTVNIMLPEPTNSGAEIAVYDQVGRSVGNGRIAAGMQSTTLDTSELASTIYFIQIKENGVQTTRKLLVTHKH
ncbi:MAG: T9SS type A sorting domain-containing protein [Bacteroidota bacterium]